MSRAEPTPQPLSIWVVNPFDDVPGEGLPPLRFWSLCRVLAGRGHDVTWWSADYSHRRKTRRTAVPAAFEAEEGFGIALLPVRPYASNVSLARLRSHRDYGHALEREAAAAVARGALERPDVILASMPPLEGAEAAARLARRLDAVLVVDLMDLWPETFRRLLPGPEWLRRLLAPWVLGGMERRRRTLLEGADGVSSSTRTYAEVALREVPGERPTHVCHLGAYLQDYPEPPRVRPVEVAAAAETTGEGGGEVEPPPARPNAPDGTLRCIYAGTLEAGQDLDTLVAATRALGAAGVAVEVHVAGTGSLESRLRAEATTVPAPARLVVHGLLPRGAYTALLARCDIGIVAVRPESLVAVPYKACDYAAAGLAILQGLGGELGALVDEHRAGAAYVAGDGASLAREIRALDGDRGRLFALRQGSRRLAEACFDREVTYARFARWIETLAD